LQRDFLNLPTEVAPLYVIGDVNADNRVDTADESLLAQLVESELRDSSQVACLAAGDVSLDGSIDRSDIALMRQLIDSGSVRSQPLYSQPYSSCRHNRYTIAAPVEWRRGEPIRVRLVGRLTTNSDSLTVFDNLGEVRSVSDGSGWDIQLPQEIAPGALVTLRIAIGASAFTYTLANFAAQEDTAKNDADIERWVEASWTDLDGDTLITPRDDPNDVPPPTIWGEEIAGVDRCPQQGAGCEALVIDFAKKTYFDVDADLTKAALENAGCIVSYSAPEFVTVPKPYWIIRASGTLILIKPDQASIDRAKAKNRAAWRGVRAAIAAHRVNIAAGREVVMQLVNGHGSGGGGYGNWGPGFSTGGGTLSRKDFHRGNYNVTRGKACYAVALDWSCYAGMTPKAIDNLNNSGVANFTDMPTLNHGYHAAFLGDMAAGASPSTETCVNGDKLQLDISTSGVINTYGRNRDFGRLAGVGLRTWILDEAASKYSDRGYNRVFGTQCETASHERSY
jgi:hypothetical protein